MELLSNQAMENKGCELCNTLALGHTGKNNNNGDQSLFQLGGLVTLYKLSGTFAFYPKPIL